MPNILQRTLKNGVNLSLRQRDITEERVDAIVNPTKSWLHHGDAGVAAAIVGTLSNKRRRPDDGNRKRDISFETSLRLYKTF